MRNALIRYVQHLLDQVIRLRLIRIVSYGVAFALLLLAVIRLTAPINPNEVAESDAMKTLLDMGHALRADISRVVRPAMERTQKLAQDPLVINALRAGGTHEQTQVCNSAVRMSTEIDAFALFNAKGKIVAINTVYASGGPIAPERIERILNMSFDGREIIQKCLRNNVSNEVLEFQTTCDITPAFFDSVGLSIAYSVPVLDPLSQRKIGVASARLKFDRLLDLIRQRTVASERGEIEFVTDRGEYFSEDIIAGRTAPPIPPSALAGILVPLVRGDVEHSFVHHDGDYISVFRLRDFVTLEGGGIQVMLKTTERWLTREAHQARVLQVVVIAGAGVLVLLFSMLMQGISAIRASEQRATAAQKQTEAALREAKRAEQELRHVAQVQDEMGEIALVGGWELDTVSGKVTWTKEIYRIFELPETFNNTREARLSFFPEESRKVIAGHVQRAIQTGEPFDYTAPFTSATGRNRWVRGRGKAERRADGSVRLFGAFQDVTESHQTNAALQESGQRFRTIADTVPQLLWTADLAGNVTYSNARCREYSGLSAEESQSWDWKSTIHPEEAEQVTQGWAKCLQTGETYSAECRMKRASDGTYRWFLVRGVPLRDSNAAISQWIGACTDIDDQKRALTIEAARIEAETANRAKSQFLANMSHEIRTPMTAILGYADMLLDPEQSVSDRHNAVNVIRRNGDHLLTVINDILDLSKIEAGEMTVESIACAPFQILAEVTSLMRVRANERGLKFEVKIEGEIPETISTDPTRLRQILINLTGNAVKFTESGWVRLNARMADPPDSPDPHIKFEVVDSGIGMSVEQMGRLFSPFTQADNSTTRRFGGTGLGLTISRQLAQSLGGDITVDSDLGRGSLFAVTIKTGPLAGVKMRREFVESIRHPDESAPSSAHNTPGIGGRILLAEDGPDNQALVGAYLRKAGAQVVVAENGRVACQKVARTLKGNGKTFDVILMDMQMPELDGYGATAKLRSMGYHGPIIALTANAMATDRTKCLQAGCTDYLSKPVKRDDLLNIIHRYMTCAPPGEPAAPAPIGAVMAPLEANECDEVLIEFLPAFIANLPKEVDALLNCLAEEHVDQLKALAHQIKGTAGLYRFPVISESASSIENEILRGAEIESIASQVRELVDLIRTVKGYDRAQEKAAST